MKPYTYWFQRNVNKEVYSSLLTFFEAYNKHKNLTPFAIDKFINFTLISFRQSRKNRFSVSKLSNKLHSHSFTVDEIKSLLMLYMNILLALAKNENKKDFLI